MSNPTQRKTFVFSLWNANGLQEKTIQEPLSHIPESQLFFITETWLYGSQIIPTNWKQYHMYGSKVPNANNRGRDGIAAFINPTCPYSVIQLPSPNRYTLSLKVNNIRIYCLYLPPTLDNTQVIDILNNIPLSQNTIICGDINARMGAILGDHNSNSRGRCVRHWIENNQLNILNSSLAYGIPTWNGIRRNTNTQSVIDLFITNMNLSMLGNATIQVESELSLGSDHRLLTLSFDLEATSEDNQHESEETCATPRRQWNLYKLGWKKRTTKYRSTFLSNVTPVMNTLASLTNNPPESRPDIDAINDDINNCLYHALDTAVGEKRYQSSTWKKYWTQELQDLATIRDQRYSRWRHAVGIDKIYWWDLHKEANKNFRRAIQKAKRESWKKFCDSLEHNFSKATATIKNIKRRHSSTTSFAHEDGPAAAADIMSRHLASIYQGNVLPQERPVYNLEPLQQLPHTTPDSTMFSEDNIKYFIKQLPRRKAPGPDHIKAEMIKPLGGLITPILSALFKICWQWSYTPLIWRQATVFPIFKKGDAKDPANYRPISLTSIIRKLFEKVLYYSVSIAAPPLDVAQGGFREQRSPLDQALCLHDLMHDYFLTHHHYPSVAFLDIKSAYDTVDRRIVWKALQESENTPPALLGLLINMFDEVKVSVLIGNHSSEPFEIATGLLQGSVLSPLLYSVYINSLPKVLRQAASSSSTMVHVPGETRPTPINSLLFADDVAIFGNRHEVQHMLDIASDHSYTLGYRWNPKKCAVVNAPSPTSSTTLNFEFILYGEKLPRVEEFIYLGVPICKKGISGPSILEHRSAGAIKNMALLTSVGVHRNGFSLLLCARLYKMFIRPKIEYGIAICNLNSVTIKSFEKLQDRLVGMFIGSTHTAVAKHILVIPGMVHRYNSLVTRYALRSRYLPDDSLVVLLSKSLRYCRLNAGLKNNRLYRTLPTPLPETDGEIKQHCDGYWQKYCDEQRDKLARQNKQVLLRACRPCTTQPDPILYLPMNKTSRSRLVRWRLGRFTSMARQECPCADGGVLLSRDHFTSCRAIDSSIIDELPIAPQGVNRIDHAINKLPTKSTDDPPEFWPALLTILWLVDTLCHPLQNIPEDPSPISSWSFSLD